MRNHEPYTKLKLALAGKGKSYGDVSTLLGVTRGTVGAKINGDSDFTLSECREMMVTFGLSYSDFSAARDK